MISYFTELFVLASLGRMKNGSERVSLSCDEKWLFFRETAKSWFSTRWTEQYCCSAACCLPAGVLSMELAYVCADCHGAKWALSVCRCVASLRVSLLTARARLP